MSKKYLNFIIQNGRVNPKIKSYLKQSLAMSWPMLVMMIFDYMLSLTDVKLSSYLGKTVQASVGLSATITYFFTLIVQAITAGTVAIVSRTYGSADREEKLPTVIFTAVVLSVCCAVVLAFLAFTVGPVIIDSMNAVPEVKEKSINLLRIYSIGLIFYLLLINLNGILRACKLMTVSMKYMVLASILNIIFNIFFVFYTPLGYLGIAASTIVATFIACMLILRVVYGLIKDKEYRFDKKVALRIVKIAWPSGIISFCWQTSAFVVFWVMGMLPDKTEIMAAYTAGLRIEALIFMPAFSFNMANAVIVGNLLGENKPKEAFYSGLATIIIGVLLILCLSVIVISFSAPIAGLLAARGEDGIADPKVMEEIIRYLKIVMIAQPFIACNAVTTGALMGAGDTKPLMYYNIISVCIVRIPIIYTGAITLGYGAHAIWWGMNFTFFCQAALVLRRFFSMKWANTNA